MTRLSIDRWLRRTTGMLAPCSSTGSLSTLCPYPRTYFAGSARRKRTGYGAAARPPADPYDLASDGAVARQGWTYRRVSRPARLRPVVDAGTRRRAPDLLRPRDGEGHCPADDDAGT